ncbi:hypothetical protein QQS21_009311 [Conoideocrella luteorostrata]|uniref:Uncharacterized protein n=1 Tax=Conoideocrella luteorostrata TaxID=1105319 RepID=A0AAJ0CJH9_9HYPO|nr:hypothetical protein QQS21_009311 [Conoideocrella luteorostrata]
MPSHPPVPPPPPPPLGGSHISGAARGIQQPTPPPVSLEGPTGAFLLELLIYNGAPFKDHWALWVRSHGHPDVGVTIHATGDVKNGFQLEIKRSHDLRHTTIKPAKRIPLQWIDGKYCNESAMFNHGKRKLDTVPVCALEASLHKIRPPGGSLNTVDNQDVRGKKVTQRNCQTWIVESTDQLVIDRIIAPSIVAYLRAIEQ